MASWLEVASSKIRSSGIIMTALAMATLCFCPPDKVIPRSPTIVSYLSGRLSIKSSIWAIFADRVLVVDNGNLEDVTDSRRNLIDASRGDGLAGGG